MRSTTVFAGVLFACMCAAADCEADIYLKNDSPDAMNVWYRKKGASNWEKPIALPKGEVKPLSIPEGTYRFCYMLPNRDYVYLAYSMVEKGQTYAMGRLAAPCAGPREGEEIEIDRDTIPCAVNALRVAGPERKKPEEPIRLGVNAYKCNEGIHVESVTAGTPAVRCFDRDTGESIQLEAGDHVIFVNGMRPKSIEDFQKLIGESERSIELKVLDRRTGKHRHLTTHLW